MNPSNHFLNGVYCTIGRQLFAADNHLSLRLLVAKDIIDRRNVEPGKKLRDLIDASEYYPANVGHMLAHSVGSQILWQHIGDQGRKVITVDVPNWPDATSDNMAGRPRIPDGERIEIILCPGGEVEWQGARFRLWIETRVAHALWTLVEEWYAANAAQAVASEAAYDEWLAAERAEFLKGLEDQRRQAKGRTLRDNPDNSIPQLGVCLHGWSPGHALARYDIIENGNDLVVLDADKDVEWEQAVDLTIGLGVNRDKAEKAIAKRFPKARRILLRNAPGTGCRYDKLIVL